MSPDSNTWEDRIIDSPVYIVLDVPSPVAEKIQSFREKFDPARAALPVEITLTGSCGTGLVTHGQTVREIAESLEQAAKQIHPFCVSFDSVDRFPGTDIYFLTLKDSPELQHAQKTVSGCGINFDPTPYPYHPHCTLALRKEIRDDLDLLNLFFLDVPQEPILLDMLSVYAMKDVNSCEILYKIALS
ncbi:MAG: 2'-5' RNA ligase family protein [Lentisphaeria bacterium]|nr:2'-5' RNA ligase family protein [Lentisphaeria bacterium]